MLCWGQAAKCCGTSSHRGLRDEVRSVAWALPHFCPTPPSGSYVSRVCDVDRVTECSPCEPGFFTAHRNQETVCLPCAECREGEWAQ